MDARDRMAEQATLKCVADNMCKEGEEMKTMMDVFNNSYSGSIRVFKNVKPKSSYIKPYLIYCYFQAKNGGTKKNKK